MNLLYSLKEALIKLSCNQTTTPIKEFSMKSILFLTLTTLSIAVPATALEVKVTCNPRVSEVWLQPNSKFETSGTA